MIAAHPENTAARLLRARAFFAAAQLRPAELEFTIVLEREPDNAFAHFALARTYERQRPPRRGQAPLPAGCRAGPEARSTCKRHASRRDGAHRRRPRSAAWREAGAAVSDATASRAAVAAGR